MREGADPPDQAIFDGAFDGDDPFETVGEFHEVEIDLPPPVGFPRLADYYVAVTMAVPDDPFLSVGPKPLSVRLLVPVARLLRLQYLLVPSDYTPPPPAVEAAVSEQFRRCLDPDAVAELVEREEARLRLEDSLFPDETIRAAREIPLGVCVVRPHPHGAGTLAEFGYYGDFHAGGEECPRDGTGESDRPTGGGASRAAPEAESPGVSLPPPPREFPTPPDGEYHVSDVHFYIGYYVPVDVRQDVLWYPDSLTVYLTFPDGEACRVETNLRNLVVWYVRVADGRPGMLPAEPYHHRVTECEDTVVLDLSDWQGGSERMLGDPGPRIRGTRDELVAFVERLLADVFDALSGADVDPRDVARELSTSVRDVDSDDLHRRLLDLQ